MQLHIPRLQRHLCHHTSEHHDLGIPRDFVCLTEVQVLTLPARGGAESIVLCGKLNGPESVDESNEGDVESCFVKKVHRIVKACGSKSLIEYLGSFSSDPDDS